MRARELGASCLLSLRASALERPQCDKNDGVAIAVAIVANPVVKIQTVSAEGPDYRAVSALLALDHAAVLAGGSAL